MALHSGVLRRVQASKAQDESYSDVGSQDEEEYSEPEGLRKKSSSKSASRLKEDDESSKSNSGTERTDDVSASEHEDQDSSSSSEQEHNSKAILSTISFGDLASAQASLKPSLKRKRGAQTETTPTASKSRSPSPFHEAGERQAGKSKHHPHPSNRASKHAPTEMSSKKAVSRRRSVISVPKVEARDPRFSNLSGGLNPNKVAQNYAFLNDYRADEMRQLKEEMRAAKDVAVKERLKRQLRAMEDRERARKKVEDERAVVREHRRAESEAVKQGKKPFYLKKADIKKQVLVKRFEGLGEKKAEKVMERRRKKKAMKERRSMPRNRKEVE